MVGSIVMSVKEGDEVKRGDEVSRILLSLCSFVFVSFADSLLAGGILCIRRIDDHRPLPAWNRYVRCGSGCEFSTIDGDARSDGNSRRKEDRELGSLGQESGSVRGRQSWTFSSIRIGCSFFFFGFDVLSVSGLALCNYTSFICRCSRLPGPIRRRSPRISRRLEKNLAREQRSHFVQVAKTKGGKARAVC